MSSGSAVGRSGDGRVDALWETALESLLIVDDRRAYRRVNPAATDLLGASAEEVLQRRIDDFTPAELWPVLERLWSELQRRGQLYGQYEVQRGDGLRVLIEFSAIADFEPERHLIAAREIGPRLTTPAAAPPQGSLLSERERQILHLAAAGNSTEQIGEALFLSRGTVKGHLEHIYDKLEVHDRAAAVAQALRRGLID